MSLRSFISKKVSVFTAFLPNCAIVVKIAQVMMSELVNLQKNKLLLKFGDRGRIGNFGVRQLVAQKVQSGDIGKSGTNQKTTLCLR